MRWNWQLPDWPNFTYDPGPLHGPEAVFLRQSGVAFGTTRHIDEANRLALIIDLVGSEALKSSEIEGEMLDRTSVQASLRRQFGLSSDLPTAGSAEQGIALMYADLYRRWAEPLTDVDLIRWQHWLLQGPVEATTDAGYRVHPEPMQVVSGRLDRPKVHFEAPPSAAVPTEMARFLAWFNATAPGGKTPLPAVTRAAIAHLYFESIHPFDDGNGRIGRAIADKALAQGSGQPSLIALAVRLQQRRREYYAELQAASRTLRIDAWVVWFAQVVLEAQQHSLDSVEFLLANTRMMTRVQSELNARETKALLRLMRAGVEGFAGGLSAGKYRAITGASAATAGRDLSHLVELAVLMRTGQGKGTRYWLAHAPPVHAH